MLWLFNNLICPGTLTTSVLDQANPWPFESLDSEALLCGQPGSQGLCSERWWGKVNSSLTLKAIYHGTEQSVVLENIVVLEIIPSFHVNETERFLMQFTVLFHYPLT